MSIRAPYALFVGPTKTGTTWIHAYLEHRGDVALPSGMKETFFFDKVYERGWSWYERLFPSPEDTRLRVEVAPSLFHKPEVVARVHAHAPYAKIICTVRDPFDRAVSHFFHYRKRGAPPVDLAEMARIYPDVIEAGLYDRHLARWKDTHGEAQVFVMSYQKLRDDPDGFCRELCQILELDYIPPAAALTNTQVNAAKLPRNLLAARIVQGVSTSLRRHGAHKVVNALKRIPIKRWLYSGGEKLQEERAEIKRQSVSFSETLAKDWDDFNTRQNSSGSTD